MRTKLPLLAGIVLAGALALYGSTQIWVTLSLTTGAAAFSSVVATGHQLNQSLSPIAIAVLAAALALTIAGQAFRRVLGVLVALLGAAVVAIAAAVWADPVAAAGSRLAEVTGISGGDEFDLVTSSTTSPFIVLTIIAGSVLCVLGVLVLIIGSRWKQAGRRYDSGAASRVAGVATEPDRISDWEAMNDGVDPSADDAREDSQ